MIPIVVLVSLLTFLHHVGAQMRAAPVPPAARGLAMGGYSTSLYLGLALVSFASAPSSRTAATRSGSREREPPA